MRYLRFCAVLACFLAGCNPLATFDPEAKANEIVLEVGARRDALGCEMVSGLDSMGFTNVCASSSMNPGEAKDKITGLMRWSGAKAEGTWRAEPGGYSRRYSYDGSSSFLIAVNTDALLITYQ